MKAAARKLNALWLFLWDVLVVCVAWGYSTALPTLVALLVALVPFLMGWLVGGGVFISLWMWSAAVEGYRRGRRT